MVGFIFAVVGSLLAVGIGALIIGRLVQSLPIGARWGLCGGVGLGAIGLATFFWGLFGLLGQGLPFYAAWALLGFLGYARNWGLLTEGKEPLGAARAFLLILMILFLVRVPAVLSPSAGDWDSLSHQMAMSQIWLDEGRITEIKFMPHSYFPATINMLYVWGLDVGGQYGAKGFSWMLALFAVLTAGGLTAHRYGRNAGWWAALAFAAVPVVLWEAGTAYQDVGHGLFAGSALLLAAFYIGDREKRWLLLSGICMGLALATKYTGFQVGLAVGLTLILFFGLAREWKRGLAAAAIVGILALLIASPWYGRNAWLTGNPVYPFYYSVFGGENWSEQNSENWSSEQKRFGIGQTNTGLNIFAMPGSVTALALTPDRQFLPPSPVGAIGPMFIVGILFWMFSGRAKREEAAVLAMLGIALVASGAWLALTGDHQAFWALAALAFLLGVLLTV
ncbi:MAG: glycosyltransferase family 39 protein, partial [Armatimonadetes bacterium]|nr:glycosyltransferase family 39 protein [Armatimonadota bacterium]